MPKKFLFIKVDFHYSVVSQKRGLKLLSFLKRLLETLYLQTRSWFKTIGILSDAVVYCIARSKILFSTATIYYTQAWKSSTDYFDTVLTFNFMKQM